MTDAANEPLTLEMWNDSTLGADTDSFNANNSANNNEDTSTDYDYTSSDSFDKLQQGSNDDNAMDNSDDYYADLDIDSYNDDSFVSDSFDMDNYASAATGAGNNAGYDELDSYQGSTSVTIQDHVRWQLNFKRLSATDIVIADYLVDSMDDMGFIRLEVNELLQSLDTMASFYQWDTQIEYDEIAAVLRIIQSCDPLGVGARNLSECLAIQLDKLAANTEHLANAQALLSATEYLISNNIKALTELTGLQPEDINPALTLLRTLNPVPGLAFQSSQPDYTQPPESYDIPDVLVTPLRHKDVTANDEYSNNQKTLATAEGWYVRLNPDTLPKLRVNKEYASLVKRGDNSSDNQYLRDNLVDARLFIRSIEERNQNLLKVATSIVRRQQDFLQQGATAMQPLILKDIAEEVDLHESTVSRLTTSKTILTPQGLFSLKHFFSSHVSSTEGDVSSTAISAMLKQLIADENPKKPLSDSRLQQHLHDDGIDIAWRTVAKYREALGIGIGSSTQRKQKY